MFEMECLKPNLRDLVIIDTNLPPLHWHSVELRKYFSDSDNSVYVVSQCVANSN